MSQDYITKADLSGGSKSLFSEAASQTGNGGRYNWEMSMTMRMDDPAFRVESETISPIGLDDQK